jgi:UDP-3-O-[3-hydroxymyristoyl] glucosamine N-acyltransferase
MKSLQPHISMSAGDLAALLNARLVGCPTAILTGVEALDRAGPEHLTFIRSAKFAPRWADSKASAVVVSAGVLLPDFDQRTRAALLVDDADRAMLAVLRLLQPKVSLSPGIHPSAVIDPAATIDPTAHIGPHASVGPGSVIGAGVVLHAGVRIGADVHIGQGSILHPGACVLDRCTLGRRCILQPAAIIGADGFGYLPGKAGLEKIPHVGNVELHDDVEIGSCTCIDRGKFGATIIGTGTKIDNLVQIAHNCRIGSHVVICGCCGIAGSVTIHDGVMIAGGVGIADGITIGKGARLAAQAGIINDVPEGEAYCGAPAMRQRDWARQQIAIKRLAESAAQARGAQQ